MSIYRYAFSMVICTKGGEICGKIFIKDEVYPIVGDANGWNMAYEKNGCPTVSLLHHYGDELIPVMAAYPDYVCLDEMSEETPRFRSIDPLKHGRWKRPWPTREKSYMRICSECGESCWYCGEGDYRYCPNCGAKMEEK